MIVADAEAMALANGNKHARTLPLSSFFDRQQASPAPPPKASVLAVNQALHAKVAKHLPYGLEVLLEDGAAGLIPLDDLCRGAFDKKELSKYPVGKKVKVIIVDPEKTPIRCSTRMEGIVDTNKPDDTYTGKPDKNGHLTFEKFTSDYHRVFELADWLGTASLDLDPERRDPKPIPYADASKYVEQYFITKYSENGVKSVSRPGILLDVLCRPCGDIPEPVLQKNENKDILLTEFAWSEIRPLAPRTADVGQPAAPEVEEEEPPVAFESESSVDPVVEEPVVEEPAAVVDVDVDVYVYVDEMRAIWRDYKGNGGAGLSFSELETKYGLKPSRGMNAHRIVKKYDMLLGEGKVKMDVVDKPPLTEAGKEEEEEDAAPEVVAEPAVNDPKSDAVLQYMCMDVRRRMILDRIHSLSIEGIKIGIWLDENKSSKDAAMALINKIEATV
jgi:hypothetical protein